LGIIVCRLEKSEKGIRENTVVFSLLSVVKVNYPAAKGYPRGYPKRRV